MGAVRDRRPGERDRRGGPRALSTLALSPCRPHLCTHFLVIKMTQDMRTLTRTFTAPNVAGSHAAAAGGDRIATGRTSHHSRRRHQRQGVDGCIFREHTLAKRVQGRGVYESQCAIFGGDVSGGWAGGNGAGRGPFTGRVERAGRGDGRIAADLLRGDDGDGVRCYWDWVADPVLLSAFAAGGLHSPIGRGTSIL